MYVEKGSVNDVCYVVDLTGCPLVVKQMIGGICDDGSLLHQLPLLLRGENCEVWIVKGEIESLRGNQSNCDGC